MDEPGDVISVLLLCFYISWYEQCWQIEEPNDIFLFDGRNSSYIVKFVFCMIILSFDSNLIEICSQG